MTRFTTDQWKAFITAERPDLAKRNLRTLDDYEGRLFIAGNEIIKVFHWEHSYFDVEWKSQDYFYKNGLQVPEVTYVGQEEKFFCMSALPGDQFKVVHFDLTEKQKSEAMRDIGLFAAKVTNLGAKEDFDRAGLRDFYFDAVFFKDLDSSFLGADHAMEVILTKACLAKKFNLYADKVKKRPGVVIHGDLYGRNILAERKPSPICGYIDFGDIAISKVPEMQLMEMVNTSGQKRYLHPAMLEGHISGEGGLTIEDIILYQFVRDAADILRVYPCAKAQKSDIKELVIPRTETALRKLEKKRGGP